MGKQKWECVFSFLVESFGGMKTFVFRRELFVFVWREFVRGTLTWGWMFIKDVLEERSAFECV